MVTIGLKFLILFSYLSLLSELAWVHVLSRTCWLGARVLATTFPYGDQNRRLLSNRRSDSMNTICIHSLFHSLFHPPWTSFSCSSGPKYHLLHLLLGPRIVSRRLDCTSHLGSDLTRSDLVPEVIRMLSAQPPCGSGFPATQLLAPFGAELLLRGSGEK